MPSINARLGSAGLYKRGRPKPYTTTSRKGGPRRITAYEGTPIAPTRGVKKASKRATSVRSALSRVQKSLASRSTKFSGLDPEQGKVLSTVLRVGDRVGATQKEKLAAVETGIVESGLRNLSHGDRDSLGWRQERAGQYGPENATDVKGGARRFFEESKTDTSEAQHRGRGMTAGQLAQAIQGSAFPERYDQERSRAKALLAGASTPRKKPAKKDLKTLKKAGVSAKPAKPPAPKKKAGQWAGSEQAVLSVIPKGIRAEGQNDKRTPEENAAVGGATDSRHLTTNPKSYAADLPPDDAVAKEIARKVGMPSHTGTNQVVKDGYRYTLIWQDEGHEDHIHFDAEWVGAGIPPGTTLGGPSGGGSSGASTGSTSSGGGGASTGASTKKKVKATRRQRLERVRSGLAGTGTTISSDTAALRRRHDSPVV